VFIYKIFGEQPGFAEGLIFNSCVNNLQNQPDLWLDECPYLYPRSSSRLPDGLRVVQLSSTEEALQQPQQTPSHPRLALAA